MTDRTRFEEGLAVRRRVLGDEYVDRAIAAADPFLTPLQAAVYCGMPAAIDAFRTAQSVLADASESGD
jgi:hypothetical protein